MKKPVWIKTRTRGIAEAKNRIGDVAGDIGKLLKKKSPIRVLEIGCGCGKALLDLKSLFGEQVETHGTNIEKRYDVNLVERFALDREIFDKKDLQRMLPRIHRLDAGRRMEFPSDYFDVIFSQSACQYIVDKALFLEEVNRILTWEGIARIDIQHVNSTYPEAHRVRFEIWKDAERIDFAEYIGKYGNISVKTAPERPHGYLVMRKAQKLDLNLKLIKFTELQYITQNLVGCNSGMRSNLGKHEPHDAV